MIVNLIQHKDYLISLNKDQRLHVYYVGDFINSSSIPKIYSSLGN